MLIEESRESVVVLDADHVPEPHFITRLIGYFRDDRLGYVQTPHAFYNFDSFQARLDHKNRRYWEEGHLCYYVIQPGRNKWSCPIFAGSAAMFRRAAIRDVGRDFGLRELGFKAQLVGHTETGIATVVRDYLPDRFLA